MKILTKKTYEKLQQIITDLKMDISDLHGQIDIYVEQVQYLQNTNREKGFFIEKLDCDIEDYKKEIKRLRQLCTKNGINYKKGDKNGK